MCVFQCDHDPGMCKTWDGHSGANACLILEPEELTSGLTELPADRPSVLREVRIVRWMERDDGILQADAPAFFTGSEYDSLSTEIQSRATWATRLGSVPAWIQSPDEGPGKDWRFLGQLDSGYSFYSPPKTSSQGVWEDPNRSEGRTHYCNGPNFGDAGIGYIFMRTDGHRPQGWFFWQCS